MPDLQPIKFPVDYSDLPDALQGGAQRWIESGIRPGSFLSAVIGNNLKEACHRADEENVRRLVQIVAWFYNEAPAPCWGSVAKAKMWAEFFGRDFDA
jgi:hypothetical protein